MSPVETKSMAHRAVNQAMSELAVAGVEPRVAAYQLAREAVLQLEVYRGNRGAVAVLEALADELIGVRR